MGLRIATNVNALNAQRSLYMTNLNMKSSMSKFSRQDTELTKQQMMLLDSRSLKI